MPSLQSRMINFLMRNRHLLRGRLKRETWDASTSIPAFRQLCEDGAAKSGALPEGVTSEALTIAGVRAEWIRLAGARPDAAIFFVHGGGYVSGSCADHRTHAAKVVKGSGVNALLFEYRLAPEHPFPAGFEDTLAVYRRLLEQGFTGDKIIFIGDSAGGGLCLAALLALKDSGLPLPAAAVAVSPWTDLALSGESYHSKREACISPYDMAIVCSQYYRGEHAVTEPYVSPLYGDLRGLPPLLILVGDDETMRDDSIQFAAKARAAGVDVTLRVEMGMTHCYPFMAPLFPEAVAAMDELCRFVQEHLMGQEKE